MNVGTTFGKANPKGWVELALAADSLGYESVWLPEHLVFPVEMRGQLIPGEEHPPVPASTPVYDAPAYLSYIAARTERVRLGTFVYLLGIRHPFIGARAFATLDVVSGGRAEAAVGAGWLLNEWEAIGLDPHTRGRRLDEAIAVCRRLWTEEVVEHHGDFYDFAPVMFEPKPIQRPHPPILVGGESRAALRRAALLGDGWIGMQHTPESAAARVAELRAMRAGSALGGPLSITVSGAIERREDLARWEDAGVDRVIVSPWERSRDAVEGLKRLAGEIFS